MVEPASLVGYLKGNAASNDMASKSSLLDINLDISSDMLLGLLSSRNIDWRETTDLYFRTMNPSLSVVHPDCFAKRLGIVANTEIPRDPQLALLIVCMQLVTQFSDLGETINMEISPITTLPAYIITKRMLAVFRVSSDPSLELVQCGILLALFEFGHGLAMQAYTTVADAASLASLLNIEPGKYIEGDQRSVEPEEEERRSVYWSLFIVDRYVLAIFRAPLRIKSNHHTHLDAQGWSC